MLDTFRVRQRPPYDYEDLAELVRSVYAKAPESNLRS